MNISLRFATALGVSLACMGLLFLVGKVPLGYNVRNLAIRWKTTIMTAMAFTLVVSLMTVMLSFVNGMYRLTEQSGQPGNVIVLSDGATDESFSNLGFADSSDVVLEPGILKTDAGKPLASREVYVVLNQPIETPPGEPAKRRFVQLRGIEDPAVAGLVHGVNLLPGGKWFSQAGVEALPGPAGVARGKEYEPQSAIQAVIGEGLAGEMGQDRADRQPLKVGDTFDMGPRKWIIVGVLASAGCTFDSEVWAKRSLVGPIAGKEGYSTIVLRTKDAAGAKQLATQLQTYKKAALYAQPETEYFSKQGETSKQFLYAIIFVAIVMAIGGVFGVMNTMFAAISQRTKDIGVLRILGFQRWQILVSFLLESLVIACLGGLIGCAIGTLADGWTAKSIVSSGQGGGKFVVLHLAVTGDTLATGMLLSLGMGALGGFFPAIAAMRLRALESLR